MSGQGAGGVARTRDRRVPKERMNVCDSRFSPRFERVVRSTGSPAAFQGFDKRDGTNRGLSSAKYRSAQNIDGRPIKPQKSLYTKKALQRFDAPDKDTY
ncbi:hypothetical protein PoB_001811400 [Plakobranchus ocellatus]|uniref:Uncharacterized protein n=1 Tax=Plakobranchus ocellatus TaxID=259542 RepID=A0AAV3ZB47_9GAST|nr:hypothetical protein PoB_001811400 [Plakobranchus ocellatus]